MNASALDIWDAAALGVEFSWRDVLCEKIDLTNLAALPVGLELRKSEGYDIPGSGGTWMVDSFLIGSAAVAAAMNFFTAIQ